MDLVGTVRPNGVGIDMGAYEYVPYSVFVPSVEGYPQEAATTAIREADLTLGAVTETFNDSVPSGNVISQNPAGGAEAVSGSAVTLLVCKKSGVPDIVGELRSDAEADIVAAGLVVGEVTERYDDNVRKDRVIRQTPAAGTELATGSPVNFVVSLGKEPAETSAVPNVVNTPSTSARAAIASAGFVVGAVTEKYDDVIPAGWVIAQSPAGGEERAAGTPVDLVVSLGKYLGPNADEVRALLAALFEEADTDGDGKLSWEEALAAVPSLSRAVFDELDTNTDGYLDRAELGLPEEGEGEGEGEGEPPLPPTAEEVLALLAAGFNAADTNGDGRISYAEALAAIPRLTLAVFNELDTDGDGALSRAELGLDEEAGCFGCQKSGFTLTDLRNRLGDLFLGGLALSLLAVSGRRTT